MVDVFKLHQPNYKYMLPETNSLPLKMALSQQDLFISHQFLRGYDTWMSQEVRTNG